MTHHGFRTGSHEEIIQAPDGHQCRERRATSGVTIGTHFPTLGRRVPKVSRRTGPGVLARHESGGSAPDGRSPETPLHGGARGAEILVWKPVSGCPCTTRFVSASVRARRQPAVCRRRKRGNEPAHNSSSASLCAVLAATGSRSSQLPAPPSANPLTPTSWTVPLCHRTSTCCAPGGAVRRDLSVRSSWENRRESGFRRLGCSVRYLTPDAWDH